MKNPYGNARILTIFQKHGFLPWNLNTNGKHDIQLSITTLIQNKHYFLFFLFSCGTKTLSCHVKLYLFKGI